VAHIKLKVEKQEIGFAAVSPATQGLDFLYVAVEVVHIKRGFAIVASLPTSHNEIDRISGVQIPECQTSPDLARNGAPIACPIPTNKEQANGEPDRCHLFGRRSQY
jgi:hypothetical protein